MVLLAMTSLAGKAQQKDYLNPPKENEEVLEIIKISLFVPYDGLAQHIYNQLLKDAKEDYPTKAVDIRDMNYQKVRGFNKNMGEYSAVGKVVWIKNKKEQAAEFEKKLSQALNKALGKVVEGSRMAIDQITLNNGMDSERLKDQIIDVLLEKGYRVVAKEYLQKLDKEIKDAIESGSFNPDTMVEEGNFSAVGYFINLKVTESSIRVQVVDVSKGEYVGNATVNF